MKTLIDCFIESYGPRETSYDPENWDKMLHVYCEGWRANTQNAKELSDYFKEMMKGEKEE